MTPSPMTPSQTPLQMTPSPMTPSQTPSQMTPSPMTPSQRQMTPSQTPENNYFNSPVPLSKKNSIKKFVTEKI
jgi:hypothetical protein